MKFCHLSAAVRANVRWKVRENWQACFPRTITANFMTVFADMFPADLWFAKAAFILLSLCWAATTVSRRQQCLFWQVPLSFLAPQMQQANPQKTLYEFMGMKLNFYIEKHRFNPKIAPERPCSSHNCCTYSNSPAAETELKSFLRDSLQHCDFAPVLPVGLSRGCAVSPALWGLCWVTSPSQREGSSRVVTLDPQTLLASLIFSVIQTRSLFCSGEFFRMSTISSLWCAVISIMKNRA